MPMIPSVIGQMKLDEPPQPLSTSQRAALDRAKERRLLRHVYHMAWHLMDSSCDSGDPHTNTVEKTDHAALEAALDAYEETFPQLAHGE